MDKSQQTIIQAKVFDFAFSELVRSKRNSFNPLWTPDSWAKFLIWIALNCGISGERESLELFAESLGAPLTSRMRKIFFERTLDEASCSLIGDPSEPNILLMQTTFEKPLNFDLVEEVLENVGLIPRVDLDRSKWQEHDGVIAIPWNALDKGT